MTHPFHDLSVDPQTHKDDADDGGEFDHEPETSIEDRLEAILKQVYGEENVKRQVYFTESQRRCDLAVNLGLKVAMIECESRISKNVEGVGQSLLYAAHHPSYIPIVAVADDHAIEEPERSYLQQHVEIIEESALYDRLHGGPNPGESALGSRSTHRRSPTDIASVIADRIFGSGNTGNGGEGEDPPDDAPPAHDDANEEATDDDDLVDHDHDYDDHADPEDEEAGGGSD